MKALVMTMLALLSLNATSCAATKTQANTINVCKILARPGDYVNKEVTLRGFVYLGVDHMNISDRNCPGQGIELVIDNDKIFNRPDIQRFYKKLNHFGRKGMVTLTGIFVIEKSPLTPNVLHVHHARDEISIN